jgi:hypothetical protein
MQDPAERQQTARLQQELSASASRAHETPLTYPEFAAAFP